MNLKIHLFLLFLGILPYSNPIFSQQDNNLIKNYTTENGLPNNHVRFIAQDHFGFLWVATWDGLATYDGTEFRKFYHVPSDSTTIPYFEISDLKIDKNNTVWVLAKKICRYCRETDKFITFSTGSELHHINSEIIYSIATDKDGNLFVLGEAGLEKYDAEKQLFLLIKEINSRYHPLLQGKISFDDQNNLWIFREELKKIFLLKNVCQISGKDTSDIVLNTYASPFPGIHLSNFVFTFKVTHSIDKSVYISSNTGLYVKKSAANEFEKCKVDKLRTVDFPDGETLIWSVLGNGLFYYHPRSHHITHFTTDKTTFIEASFIDDKHILWYSGMNKNEEGAGLTKMICSRSGFYYYPDKQENKENKLAVFSIFKDSEKNLWIGTKNFNYLLKIRPDGKILTENVLDQRLQKLGGHARAIVEDKDHTLWVGYFDGLLMKFDHSQGKFIPYYPGVLKGNQSGNIESFKHLKILSENKILTTGHSDICIFNRHTNKILYSYNMRGKGDIYSVYEDHAHDLWFGGNGKLLHFNSTLQLIETLMVGSGEYNIEYICEDTLNAVWLAMLGGGTCNFDLITHKNTIFTTANGLSNNTTYSILKDRQGNLWISTDEGISMFNPRTQQFVNYGASDGLSIEEFNADAAYLSGDGEMFFGGMGGVVSFYPDSLIRMGQRNDPPVVLTKVNLLLNGHSQYIQLYSDSLLLLPKGTRNVTLRFSYLDFMNPQKTLFRYRLKGVEEEWENLTSDERSIPLMGLKPGHFEFQLESTDQRGEWTKKASVSIIIPPFYYQTLFFRIIAEFIVFILLVLFVVIEVRNLRLRQYRKVAQLKIITMQEQLNPHFMANSLSALESFIHSGDEILTNRYIAEVTGLMRDMINYSGKSYIPLKHELALIERYLNIMQISKDFMFEYEIHTHDLNIEMYSIAPCMVQPFLENAIRHGVALLIGKKGKIVVDFEKPGKKYIVCTIRDNGIGWKRSSAMKIHHEEPSGIIEIIRERLKLYNSLNKTKLQLNITDVFPDKHDSGTLARIEIPMLKTHL
ncbi:MAG: histidine kinase [Bacteroidetes bacterium]|nr:histidine kinase [Bacteroidota bacterium]